MQAFRNRMAKSFGKFRRERRNPSHSSRRGAVVALAAVLMIVLLGFLAFSIDLGYIQVALSDLQTAADAGALAGARGLTVCCTSSALSEAKRVAELNSVFQTPVSVVSASDIDLGTWDHTSSSFTVLTGTAVSNANAVRVTCRVSAARGNALPLIFARIFGLNSQDLSASAVAQSTPVTCGAFIGLNYATISGGSYTDSYDSSTSAYASGGTKGNVCSNGNISLSGGSTVVHGNAHPGIGHTVGESGGSSVTGSTTPLTKALVEAAVDPGTAATTNDNGTIPLSAQGKDPLKSGSFTLGGGDSLTLSPGTYYFSTLTLSGGASLGITGKSIIYVNGKIDCSGGSLTNITAIPSNLQLYGMGTTVVLSGASQTYAVVYAPTADITRSGGTSDFFGMMVGASLTLSGGGGLHADTGITGISGTTKKASLVQ